MNMAKDHDAPRRPRPSLTWRVVMLSSLLLVALAVLITYLSWANMNKQLDSDRQEQVEQHRRELHFALSRAETSLKQLAGVVAAAPQLSQALEASDALAVDAALSSQWPTLQLESGIEEIRVYDSSNHLLFKQGTPTLEDEKDFRAWTAQVMGQERPLSTLRCTPQCFHYAAVPILGDGGSVGSLVISSSLAYVTRQAKELSSSETALVVNHTRGPVDARPERHIDSWNAWVIAVTNQDVSMPILHQAAPKIALQDLETTPWRLTHSSRELEISAIPILPQPARASSNNATSAYFLLVSDVTAQINAIRLDTRTLMLASLFGWLSAELLLLAILLNPMARLRRIAAVLPPLASGGFDQVRAALSPKNKLWPDEIDILEHSTLSLANQLDLLQQEVQIRGDELAQRVNELARERDFISSLIDTAQVFIVTLDDEGRINLVNAHLEEKLQTPASTLLGRRFDDVFPDEGAAQPSSNVTELRYEERELVIPSGECHTIIWHHSPFPRDNENSQARISVGLDITERKAAEARLTWLAERDPLTELYNRRFFQEALNKALAQGHHGSVLLFDLDQFKEVNELSGHHAGDRMLHEVARLLQQEYTHRGTVARLGGDEFALLLTGVDSDQTISVAKHLNQLLDSLSFVAEGHRHRISASIGIVQFPTHGTTPADLMASADMAMYKAKENPLQRWHLLSALANARDELNERVYWSERIRRALDDDDFVLMVQPIVHMKSHSIRHYEVLLRMRDGDRLIPPSRFIPLAEHSGQIIAIDRWVLHHCVQALAHLKGISLAVNLSGQSLHDEGLNQFLADELAEYDADPHHLILEVTETAAITDFSTARGVLQSMRDLGCHTALDDFGVGFSSFHYLGQLPVDYIKIDGSFIRSLAVSADSRVIVKAVADIAFGFGKQAIAEYVDHEALIPLLTSYGIEYGQGFHLGQPVPMEEAFGFDPVKL
ncbi:EAL domain-containing protein [Halomonas binhaiensis]